MPVSNISTFTAWSTNLGAARWMGMNLVALTGPPSSTGWPTTLRMRPSTSSPTGIRIGLPVFLTAMPRTRPSVVSMATQRTVRSPRCCATSTTRLSGRSSIAGLVTVSAVLISGSVAPLERDVDHRADDLEDVSLGVGFRYGARPFAFATRATFQIRESVSP